MRNKKLSTYNLAYLCENKKNYYHSYTPIVLPLNKYYKYNYIFTLIKYIIFYLPP